MGQLATLPIHLPRWRSEMRGKTLEPPPDVAAGDSGTGHDIDARIDEASRSGLTGTARSDVYAPTRDPDDVSRAPDVRDELDPPAWRRDFPIDWPKDEFV